MASNHIRVLALVSALAACATSAPGDVRFELGAAEFPGGDEIVVDHVASSTGDFSPGAVVTVRGRYVLASRATGRLELGTTETGSAGERFMSPNEQVVVDRGSGQFELAHRVPAAGFLHVTLYDPDSGRPFGGQYFGRGDSLLVAKDWSYAR